MKPVHNWRAVLRKAWSVRLMILAALLSGGEVVLPFFQDWIPAGVFAGLSGLTVAAAFVARLVLAGGSGGMPAASTIKRNADQSFLYRFPLHPDAVSGKPSAHAGSSQISRSNSFTSPKPRGTSVMISS